MSNVSKPPPLVVVFPIGQLSPKDKERLTKHGILAVEAADPKNVVQLQLSQPVHLHQSLINADAITRSLLQALAAQPAETMSSSITSTGRASYEFVKLLAAACKQHGVEKG